MGHETVSSAHGVPPLTIGWSTDIHLNLAGPHAREAWISGLKAAAPDLVVITGDISHNRRVGTDIIKAARDLAPIPLRFVLGNHDMWGPSDQHDTDHDTVRQSVRAALNSYRAPRGSAPPVYVHDDVDPAQAAIGAHAGFVCLGVDGWWDFRAGIPFRKSYLGSDYESSEFVRNMAHYARIADRDTWTLRERLDRAVSAGATDVIVLTHVPPFVEACRHNGNPTDPHLIQYFSNVGMGTMLAEVAAAHRRVRFTVLCGHTHSDGEARPAPNLHVFVQGAEHGAPASQLVRFDPLSRVPSRRDLSPSPWADFPPSS